MEIPYSSLPGVPRSNGFLSTSYYSRNNQYDGSSYYTDETEEEVKMLFQLLEKFFKFVLMPFTRNLIVQHTFSYFYSLIDIQRMWLLVTN